MTAPLLSIIIPTHNRVAILGKCLRALELQAASQDAFEVIVVDDGSTDGTRDTLQDGRWDLNLKRLSIPHSGAAEARNRGATLAEGDLLLFLGDDMLAEDQVVHAHMSAHARRPAENVGVVGHITWAENVLSTPFQRYLEEDESVWQFSLSGFDIEDMPFGRMYGSNLSMKRSLFARHGGFDPAFSLPAYDDTDLEYRFRQAGFRLVYEARARVSHDHAYDLRSYYRRNHMVGRVAVQLSVKHPKLALSSGLVSMLVMRSDAEELNNTIQRLQQEEEHLQRLPVESDTYDRAYQELRAQWFRVLLGATSVGAWEAATERGWTDLNDLRLLQAGPAETMHRHARTHVAVTLGAEPEIMGISVVPPVEGDCKQALTTSKGVTRIQAAGPCNLCFRVDPYFLLAREGPLHLSIEYMDAGSCVWHVTYDSVDVSVLRSPAAPGALKQTNPVRHGNTGIWRKATFVLTDWLFLGRCNGDFCIELEAPDKEGLCIHRIELRSEEFVEAGGEVEATAIASMRA